MYRTEHAVLHGRPHLAEAWRGLARQAGISLAHMADLIERGEVDTLFDDETGKLKNAIPDTGSPLQRWLVERREHFERRDEELANQRATRTGRQALIEIMGKRWPRVF